MAALDEKTTDTDPLTGQPIAVQGSGLANAPATSTSAPLPPGTNADVTGAPLSQNGTQPPQGGGAEPSGQGAPDTLKDRGDPNTAMRRKWQENAAELVEMQEQALTRMQNAWKDPVSKAQGQVMTENMKAQGADPTKAAEQSLEMAETNIDRSVEDKGMTKKMGAKLKKRLRKVYDTIPEDQMGMFLIDFGLRAMMAGETMGSMGALGAAGSGAMGAMQGRQRQEKTDRLSMEQAAQAEGREQFGALSDRTRADAAMMTAEAQRDRAGRVNRFKDEVMIDFYRKQGWSEEEITAEISGAQTAQQMYDVYAPAFDKIRSAIKADPPMIPSQIQYVEVGGEKVAIHEMDEGQVAAYIGEVVEQRMAARGALGKENALSKSGQDYINEAT